jgi:hypothetical protein
MGVVGPRRGHDFWVFRCVAFLRYSGDYMIDLVYFFLNTLGVWRWGIDGTYTRIAATWTSVGH